MATRTVYPGVKPDGTRVSVLAQDGVTQIPNAGAVVTNSEYYERLIAQQRLLDYDPSPPSGNPITLVVAPLVLSGSPDPGDVPVYSGPGSLVWAPGGAGGDTTGVLAEALSSDPGIIDSAIKTTTGHAVKGNGGGHWFWNAGDATAANGWECVAATGGRWRRIWSREIDVRWFGARGGAYTGPSGHGDTAAIQAAINAAEAFNATLVAGGGQPGVTVRLQPTCYIVSDEGTLRAWKLLLRSNVTIEGGGVATELRSALGQNLTARCFSSVNGTVLRNCTIRGIHINGRESEMYEGDTVNYQRAGILVHDAEDITIENCWIQNTGDCIRLFGPTVDRAIVRGNRIWNCPHGIGREIIQIEGCHDAVVEGNVIWDCPWATAIKMEGSAPGTHNNVVANNTCRNVGGGIAVAPGSVIVGNRIEAVNGLGIQVLGEALIVGNRVTGALFVGIQVVNNTASPQRVVVQGNHVSGVIGEETSPVGVDISVLNGFVPTNCIVTGNVIYGFAGDAAAQAIGVRLDQVGDDMTVSANHIKDVIIGVAAGPHLSGTTVMRAVDVSHNNIQLLTGGFGVQSGCDVDHVVHSLRISNNTVRPHVGATSTTGIFTAGPINRLTTVGNDTSACTTPYTHSGTAATNAVSGLNQGF